MILVSVYILLIFYELMTNKQIGWVSRVKALLAIKSGVVKVSTGYLKSEKQAAWNALNAKLKLNAEDNLAVAA